MKTHWQLFIAFFRVGMLGYGGGPASIPLVHKEVVDTYKWMDEKEFGDILAIANTLPGPIITKLAGYIGYRVTGFWGMMNAILASTVPTIILMVVILSSLHTIREFDWVKGMTAAVIPVVGMMMTVLTWQFFNNGRKGLGWLKTLLMSAVFLLLLQGFHLHPAIIITLLLVSALVQKDSQQKNVDHEEGKAI